MTSTPTPPLVVATRDLDDIKVPFEGDLLNRKGVADRLTGYLERLRVGAVIALDAPWGEGKSWFGRHWAASLRDQGYATGWIDAFEQDYVEDAFLPLAATVLELCERDRTGSERVKAGAGAVMRALLPVVTKALINVAGRGVGVAGLADEFGEAVKNTAAEAARDGAASVGDAAAAWVERRLEDWGQERATVAHFRKTLAEFAVNQHKRFQKPVVIVVDELDRCRPEFAVRLIERIKHFFDVPHLVFVLLMNRNQLENAIRGVYGSETDAAIYLGKFLHLSLRLPKDTTRDVLQRQNATQRFLRAKLGEHGIENDEAFIACFGACAAAFDLSLRDMERGCSLYALSGTEAPRMAAYLIALKIRQPTLFRDLGRPVDRVNVHKTCSDRLAQEVTAAKEASPEPNAHSSWRFPAGYFYSLQLLHDYHLGKWPDEEAFYQEGGTALSQLLDEVHSRAWAFSDVIRTLDLDIR